jgi:hypothetical protein
MAHDMFPEGSPLRNFNKRSCILAFHHGIKTVGDLDSWLSSHKTAVAAAKAIKKHELTGDQSVKELFAASTLPWSISDVRIGQQAPFSRRVAELEESLADALEQLDDLRLRHDALLARVNEHLDGHRHEC